MKNTSIFLGNYFDQFVQTQVSAGRYKNVSEVIRAGLRLLGKEESKVIVLKNAIQEGLNSPRVENFDFDENLKKLKAEKKKFTWTQIRKARNILPYDLRRRNRG